MYLKILNLTSIAGGYFSLKLQEKRYTDQRTAAEADKLPLREVEQEFGFDMG